MSPFFFPSHSHFEKKKMHFFVFLLDASTTPSKYFRALPSRPVFSTRLTASRINHYSIFFFSRSVFICSIPPTHTHTHTNPFGPGNVKADRRRNGEKKTLYRSYSSFRFFKKGKKKKNLIWRFNQRLVDRSDAYFHPFSGTQCCLSSPERHANWKRMQTTEARNSTHISHQQLWLSE